MEELSVNEAWEGVDILGVSSCIDATPQRSGDACAKDRDILLRPFKLPEDTERLCLYAAAVGMRAFMQDYPLARERRKVEQSARYICMTTRYTCPEVANDYAAYRQIFVEGYALGYQVAYDHIGALPPLRRDVVAAKTRHLDMARAMELYAAMLQILIKEHGVESIFDLPGCY